MYIIRFGPNCLHSFIPGDASPFLSLTPQNAYNMLATSTINKALTLDTRFQYGISQYKMIFLYNIDKETH